MAKGGVEAGPNAVFAYAREGYRHTDINLADLWRTVSFKGFWAITGKYWQTGFGELYRSLSKSAFVRALQKLLPEIRESDLVPGGAGVRAQAVSASGALGRRFRHQAKPPYDPRPQRPLARRHRVPRHRPADLRDGRKEFRAQELIRIYCRARGVLPINPSFHCAGLNVSRKSATYLSKSSITCCSNGSKLVRLQVRSRHVGPSRNPPARANGFHARPRQQKIVEQRGGIYCSRRLLVIAAATLEIGITPSSTDQSTGAP